jgi:hypothetical protein
MGYHPGMQFSRHCLLIRCLALTLSASTSLVCSLASAAADSSKKNIFAVQGATSEPGFKKSPDNAAAIQDRAVPDIRMVLSLPSLEAIQRKQIQRLYKDSQTRLVGLRTEINGMRNRAQKMAEVAGKNGNLEPSKSNSHAPDDDIAASKFEARPQDRSIGSSRSEMLAQDGSSEPMDNPDRENSQNPPGPDFMVEVQRAESARVLSVRVRELQSQIRTERQSLWEQIRPILSDEQMDDLGKMRRGELMPQTTQAAK